MHASPGLLVRTSRILCLNTFFAPFGAKIPVGEGFSIPQKKFAEFGKND